MILNNIQMPGHEGLFSVSIGGSKIATVSREPFGDAVSLSLEGALAFPGLINSHDHLDFNLFPQLGNRVYTDYTAWGKHIHQEHTDEIAEVLAIPVDLRVKWGIYKNLLCGVTTVVNHGEKLEINNPPITVFQDCESLHSVKFEKHWKLKLNNPFRRQPVVIHSGEGLDGKSHDEIDELLKWNLFRKDLVAVHGVAMDNAQAAKFKALIWCPFSNYFLLNKTARIQELSKSATILFGTDSTLTSDWNIWEHLRLARRTDKLSDGQIFDSLTRDAAATWGLSTGMLSAGKGADIVIAKPAASFSGWDNFYNLNPEDLLLVMHQGNIRLFDSSLYDKLSTQVQLTAFNSITIGGSEKYIEGDIQKLMAEIKNYCPTAPVHLPAPALHVHDQAS